MEQHPLIGSLTPAGKAGLVSGALVPVHPPELVDPEMLRVIGAMPLAGVTSINSGVDGREVVAGLLPQTAALSGG